MRGDTKRWIEQDKSYAWHPFTQQSEWCKTDNNPLVITRGEGIYLYDSEGHRYIDGNSSIWTNIHGHSHPAINEAIKAQVDQVAHTSYLGFANPRASELAEKLISLVSDTQLERVFFSDDGSTALECAFKMALQYREIMGEPERDQFVVFENAYHGDTLGAASLGGVTRFSSAARKTGYKNIVARSLNDLSSLDTSEICAVVIEPLVQGVNEMKLWPQGMLRELRAWCDENGVQLILDEVMTGFGRTGKMFAYQHEDVEPDFLCLAKGLTGGYSPLAATLATKKTYNVFLGSPDKTFYYGHSFTGHQIGCAAALANIEIFGKEGTISNVTERAEDLKNLLQSLKKTHTIIREVRQIGLIIGIEIEGIAGTAERVCALARKRGLITRPILNTIVIMPPLCISKQETQELVVTLDSAFHAYSKPSN